MIRASSLVDEVFALGGKVVLERGVAQPQLSLSLPKGAASLRDEHMGIHIELEPEKGVAHG